MNFTSHNVLLPNGSSTAPDHALVADSGACKTALAYLEAEFAGQDPAEVLVADVGCLEGGYAVEFARAGYEVIGIDARKENLDNANELRDVLGLTNLTFIQGDAYDVLAHPMSDFDAVFCCGLLYHLDNPVQFVNLLGKVTRRMLLLNTHVSQHNGHPEWAHRDGEWCDSNDVQHEGRWGHWFHEIPTRWSSYESDKSFWLQKAELFDCLRGAGFVSVDEILDWHGDVVGLPYGSGGVFSDRVMVVALKGAAHG